MALNAGPLLVYSANGSKNLSDSKLDITLLAGGRPNFSNSRVQRDLKCLCQRAVAPVDDEIPSARDVAQRPPLILHKDLTSLPSESPNLFQFIS